MKTIGITIIFALMAYLVGYVATNVNGSVPYVEPVPSPTSRADI